MKKVLKVLSLVLVFALAIMPMTVFADVPLDLSGGGQDVLPDEVTTWGASIVSVLTTVGYIVAVVMTLWLGIQWILATPNKKAELKGRMWSMAIGIVLLVAGMTIINALWGAAGNLN